MRANPNTRGVNDNWNESVKVLRLEVDQAKARALGVTSQSIAQASQHHPVSGTTVGQYREGDKLIDIVLRQPPDERNAITDIGNAYLPTASGKSIPLTQIAKPVFTWEPGVMWRENRDYAITVQGDIVEGLQGATVTERAAARAARRWRRRWPPGLTATASRWPARWRKAARARRRSSAGVPIMLFIIFTLLMLQLHSFSRAMLVFLTGPLGIAGVAGALLLLDRPFGFVALLGVIALMGMIQRNSVILIDQIEQDRAARRAGLGRHRRVGGAAPAAHRADGRRGGAGDDPAVAQRVLGADGRGHHGRPDRGHRADAAGAAGDVRRLVPRAQARRRAAAGAPAGSRSKIARLTDFERAVWHDRPPVLA